jgi:hypothetical protein
MRFGGRGCLARRREPHGRSPAHHAAVLGHNDAERGQYAEEDAVFRTMLSAILSTAMAALAAVSDAQAQVALDRPLLIMDGGGFRIFAVELKRIGDDRYEVITRFEGRTTGISYTRYEVECATFRTRMLREAYTMEDVRTARPAGPAAWNTLIQGSGQWWVARLACHNEVFAR